MLTIYGVYRSRAARNYWMAMELGIPFTSTPVIQGRRLDDPMAPGTPLNTHSPAFLAINPMGQIPCVDDDGFVMTESLAINLYLARKHGGPLSAHSVQEEAEMLRWTLWAATEVEPHAVKIVMTHDAGAAETEAGRMAIRTATRFLKKSFSVLEAHLSTTPYLVGGRFTAADLNLSEVLRYTMSERELFDAAPAVTAWHARCHARPAFQSMMATRSAEAE